MACSGLLRVFPRPDEDIAEDVRREIVTHLLALPVTCVDVRVHDGVPHDVTRPRFGEASASKRAIWWAARR
ncbi:hypothetical protein [Streptomyces sp. NPDC058739]|uniref:hypothetical protein n=1 Tax=Streptomyces sp. NPDC058739 TaxID=3346618 RepID=UPI00368A91FE